MGRPGCTPQIFAVLRRSLMILYIIQFGRFPMTSRRQFMVAGATASLFHAAPLRAAKTRSTFSYPELEARIARRDFRDMTKDVLPTPCMIVDLDLFEKNVK